MKAGDEKDAEGSKKAGNSLKDVDGERNGKRKRGDAGKEITDMAWKYWQKSHGCCQEHRPQGI